MLPSSITSASRRLCSVSYKSVAISQTRLQVKWTSSSSSASPTPGDMITNLKDSSRPNPPTNDRTIRGCATSEATKKFLIKFEVPLTHQFFTSSLFINPIVHGPPRVPMIPGVAHMSKVDADRNIAKAVLHNKSNCVYVYDHTKSRVWHSNVLVKLISEHKAVSRQELVVLAGLGEVNNASVIESRLLDACKLCELEHIDMAIIQLTHETFTHSPEILNEALAKLEELCCNGTLISYGLEMNFPPYSYHKPPAKTSQSRLMLAPSLIEDDIKASMPNADLVVYTISPSHNFPASYSMLSRSSNLESENPDLELTDEVDERTFTRAARHPFTCMRGLGSEDSNIEYAGELEEFDERINGDPTTLVELISVHPSHLGDDQKVNEEILLREREIAATLDDLCPPMMSTPRLQDKALRAVFSVGVDIVLVDSESSVRCGKLSLQPDHLLDVKSTEQLFGGFCIPSASASS